MAMRYYLPHDGVMNFEDSVFVIYFIDFLFHDTPPSHLLYSVHPTLPPFTYSVQTTLYPLSSSVIPRWYSYHYGHHNHSTFLELNGFCTAKFPSISSKETIITSITVKNTKNTVQVRGRMSTLFPGKCDLDFIFPIQLIVV